jgi:hypothetical protein
LAGARNEHRADDPSIQDTDGHAAGRPNFQLRHPTHPNPGGAVDPPVDRGHLQAFPRPYASYSDERVVPVRQRACHAPRPGRDRRHRCLEGSRAWCQTVPGSEQGVGESDRATVEQVDDHRRGASARCDLGDKTIGEFARCDDVRRRAGPRLSVSGHHDPKLVLFVVVGSRDQFHRRIVHAPATPSGMTRPQRALYDRPQPACHGPGLRSRNIPRWTARKRCPQCMSTTASADSVSRLGDPVTSGRPELRPGSTPAAAGRPS